MRYFLFYDGVYRQSMSNLLDIDKLARSPLTTDCLISVESLPGNIPVSASVAFVASLGVGLVGQIVSAGKWNRGMLEQNKVNMIFLSLQSLAWRTERPVILTVKIWELAVQEAVIWL